MNKILPALALFVAPLTGFSQAQMVIHGASAVTVVESGGTAGTPIYIEIANPAANAITTVGGNNGWIISEAEFNMVKWDISSNTGNYTLPFGLGTTYSLPLTLAIGTAGSAGGSILFSTYHTDPDNGDGSIAPYNAFPFHTYPDIIPTDVSLMSAMNAGGSPSNRDNSYNAVDRFWIMDTYAGAFSYGTKPAATSVTFTYAHSGASAEFAAPNTVADESDLIAQRFNAVSGTWGDWLGSGPWAIAGNVGTVDNTNAVTPANFYRSWTLSNSINPLPIVLSSFTAQCDNGAALIQWTTQSELNNASFTVKKTTDNIHFETVTTMAGAGTTSMPSNYSYTDQSPYPGHSYYVLFQTDVDGNTTNVGNIPFDGCGGGANPTTTVNAFNTTNNIQVQINSPQADNFYISLVNMLGQVMFSGSHAVALGNNEIMLPNNISSGIYILNVRNDKVNYAKKMVIGVR